MALFFVIQKESLFYVFTNYVKTHKIEIPSE
jgi:hypothetical protein